jgi:hypothetical protein
MLAVGNGCFACADARRKAAPMRKMVHSSMDFTRPGQLCTERKLLASRRPVRRSVM